MRRQLVFWTGLGLTYALLVVIGSMRIPGSGEHAPAREPLPSREVPVGNDVPYVEQNSKDPDSERNAVPQANSSREIDAPSASLETEVHQLAKWKPGPPLDRAVDALAKQGNAAVTEIGRQIEEDGSHFGRVHASVRVLKAVNTPESRLLLRRIALGELKVKNSNLEDWAARALISCDQNEASTLLSAANTDVVIESLNSLVGLPVDESRMQQLRQCLQNDDRAVRWRAAEILATAPSGKLANEAVKAIEQVLTAVADLPDGDEPDSSGPKFATSQTLAEASYSRYINALREARVEVEVLQDLAGRRQGRARDAVILAIALRGDKSVHDAIIQVAQDPNAGLFRSWAVSSLQQIGTVNDIKVLQSLAKTDPLMRRGPVPGGSDQMGSIYPVRLAAEEAIRVIEHEAGKQ